MRKILLIAKRDYLAVVRTKAFLIGLVALPIVFGGGSVGSALVQNRAGAKSRQVAILDPTGAAAAAIVQAAKDKTEEDRLSKTAGLQASPQFDFETVAPDHAGLDEQRLALSDRLRSGNLAAVLELDPDTLHPRTNPPPPVRYYTNSGGIDTAQGWLADAVNEGLRRARLTELGVAESHFKELLTNTPLQSTSLVARDPRTGAIGAPRKRGQAESFAVPFITVMLLAMIVLIGASPMLSAVAEDKLQRVYEMLLATATPFELMAGKVLAAIGQSLTSSVFYIIGGLLVLEGMALIGMAPLWVLPWFFIYLVAEVTMLCAMGVALGATCGSPQDAQHLALPLLFPVVIPLFLIGPILQQPNGPLATALSLFPLFTPIVMMLSQTLPGSVPAWQPWVGLAGVLIVTPIITWGAARIFRVAILLQGQRPNAAQLLRMAVRG